MIISQIMAFSLHLHIYSIVTTATSIKQLEDRIQSISLSETYSQECYKEWTSRKLLQNCILLVETAAQFINRSPQKVRTLINNHCKNSLDWRSSLSDFTNTNFPALQKYIRAYPECQHQLREYLLDRQYKMRKEQLYKKTEHF